MSDEPWDGDCVLGPFYDEDGTEVLPCTTEATDELLAECMGHYQIGANLLALDGQRLLLCNRLLTRYIQENWNEVMGGGATAGFLLAYQSAHKAVGRLAEDLLCRELVRLLVPQQRGAVRMLTVRGAYEQGLLAQPDRGQRSDDVFAQLADGQAWLAESKASFSGGPYVRRCLPKALAQLRAMVELNAHVEQVLLVLSALRQKRIAVVKLPTAQLMSPDGAEAFASAGRLVARSQDKPSG